MVRYELTNMVMVQDPVTGKVLVQRRVQKYKGIAFPGGHLEEGESIYDSAVREIKEETGYDIRNLESCGFIYWDEPNVERYFTYFYKTTDFSGKMIPETEEGPVFWMDPEELEHTDLSPNMEKYLPMFTGKYSECYCLWSDDHWEVSYR